MSIAWPNRGLLMRRFAFALTLLLGLLGTPCGHGADFTIELSVRAGKDGKVAEAAYPSADRKPRTVLNAAADTAMTVRWTVRNIDTATVPDVLVHFFAVKQDRPDQPEVPKLNKHVVVKSA